jgi:hypothetical protein
MLSARAYTLPIADCQKALGDIDPNPGVTYSRSLLGKLVAEGVFARELRWTANGEDSQPVIRFGYQRLADYHLARRLLERYLPAEDVSAPGKLRERPLFQRDNTYGNQGLLAALTVLVPERTGRELVALVPHLREDRAYREAFLEALPWRMAEQVTGETTAFIEELLAQGTPSSTSHSHADAVLDRVLQLAAVPHHPLNARWIHQRLRPLSRAERDLAWSTFLHRTRADKPWRKPRAVDRLLAWAWPTEADGKDPCSGFDAEVVRLVVITLTWCLTTSNRFVRDQATKALVSVLQHRVSLIPELIAEFRGVDDLYLWERLYASSYGAVMRSSDPAAVVSAAQAVYQAVFASGPPSAHVLLRDYARGVIEYAVTLGCALEVDLPRIRPPYSSEPLQTEIPAWEELRKLYDRCEYFDLMFSLDSGIADFARYILGTDSFDQGLNTWTDQPDPYAAARVRNAERVELPTALAVRLAEALGRPRFQDFIIHVVGSEDDEGDARVESPHEEQLGAGEQPEAEETQEGALEARWEAFFDSLTPEERELVERHLEADKRWQDAREAAREKDQSNHGPADYSPRWILLRVMELGWTPERFAEFDRGVNQNDMRASQKPERIGKKYQWLAYHELAARTFDRRPWHHSDNDGSQRYEGPWQRHFRDIDPSLLVKASRPDHSSGEIWCLPVPPPLPAAVELGDREWLTHLPSLPDFSRLFELRRPRDGTVWYPLHVHGEWREPAKGSMDQSGGYRRLVTYSLDACVVCTEAIQATIDCIGRWEWNGTSLPRADLHGQFLGEYIWAASFQELIDSAARELTEPYQYDSAELFQIPGAPGAAAVTTLRYSHSGHGYDCSLPESVSGYAPSVWLARRMGLTWKRRRFAFGDETGRVVAFDPSHEPEGGPEGLVVERGSLLQFLKGHGLTLVWLLIGEKLLLGDRGFSRHDDRPVVQVFREAVTLTEDEVSPAFRTTCPLGGTPVRY